MKDLTKGNIYKTFLLFAIPMVLSSLLSQAYSTIDTILAGKLLGDGALAATGSLAPFETFINSVFWGYGMGVGIYVSHLFGAQRYQKIKQVVVNNFRVTSAALLAISCLSVFFRQYLYRLLNIDLQILPQCNRYFIITTAGKVFILFVANCAYVFHAIGDSSFPFLISLLTAALNIVVSAGSVLLLHMGVEGLALGTVAAAVICTAIYLYRLGVVFRKMGVGKGKTPLELGSVRETCKYSLSTMTQQSIMYFATFFLSPMVNNIGSAASASYTVTSRIYDINASVYVHSSKTVGSYTAQCYGAKKYNLLKKGVRVGLLQSVLFVLPVVLVCSLFARPVTGFFYQADADPVSVQYTVDFLRYCLPLLFINVFANLYHNFFRGLGKMRALLITTIAGSVVRIVVSGLLIGPFGIYGYYAGWVMSWVIDAAVGIGIYYFGSWRKVLSA